MTTLTRTGYQKDNTGVWIPKDNLAQLIYSMDWSEWLPTGDTITAVTYTVQARANDPAPVVKGSNGIQSGYITYVTLSGGQVGKIYTVTASITTSSGLVDRRNFRVKIEERSA